MLTFCEGDRAFKFNMAQLQRRSIKRCGAVHNHVVAWGCKNEVALVSKTCFAALQQLQKKIDFAVLSFVSLLIVSYEVNALWGFFNLSPLRLAREYMEYCFLNRILEY